MSVYTPVERESLLAFLQPYALGDLLSYAGIAAGVENTNYFVTTSTGEYVLTLFEKLTAQQLPFYLRLMQSLSTQGIPVPVPLFTVSGETLSTLHGKPAALFGKLPGNSIETPNLQQCQVIGSQLARLHLAGHARPTLLLPANGRGFPWWKQSATQLQEKLSLNEQQLLQDELAFQSHYRLDDLPRGLIHADLFRDNALFIDNQLSGILDLYTACEGNWLYDLAIVVIDWTSHQASLPEQELSRTILESYSRIRPLTSLEQGAWPVVLRQAALRFWLSRLLDWHQPRQGTLGEARDPAVFASRLAEFVKNETYLRDLWPKGQNPMFSSR